MTLRCRFPGLDEPKGPTAAAALLAALVAGCSLDVGGLQGGTRGTTSSAAGTASAGTEATSSGAGGASPATGAGGATSASGAGGGTSTALTWRSFNITADATTGALSVPGDTAATPAATLTAYWANSVDDTKPSRVAMTSYHVGPLNGEDVSWYVTDDVASLYPYVGRSASPRDASQGPLEPQNALDLQVSMEDLDPRPVFVAFAAPVGGLYKLKDVAARCFFLITNGDVPFLRVYQNLGGAISPVGATLDSGADQKWHPASSRYDFPMALAKDDQIIFEVNPNSSSKTDVMELAWTIEATVP